MTKFPELKFKDPELSLPDMMTKFEQPERANSIQDRGHRGHNSEESQASDKDSYDHDSEGDKPEMGASHRESKF